MLSAHSPHLHTQPPTKASLKAWWNHFIFIQRTKKEPSYVREYEKGPSPGILLHTPQFTFPLQGSPAEHPVFGKPLVESLKYASVPISTANHNGELYVWGYVPVVVAKWCACSSSFSCWSPWLIDSISGLYLKENGMLQTLAT